MEYVILSKSEQKKLLRKAKDKLGLTWPQLAKKLGIHKGTLYFNLRGEGRMPKERYEFLAAKASYYQKNVQTIIIHNKPNKPKLPTSMNESLAEFIGALAGDGHVSKQKYQISFCADKDLDKHFITLHIPDLFSKLFKLKAKNKIQKNCAYCYVCCKELHQYLTKEFDIPSGKKKGKLNIPNAILVKDKYLIAYLRGLFDTDGSFYQHHRTDAAVAYISRDYVFLKEVQDALIRLGFRASRSGKSVYIYAKADVERFFSLIRPSNKKHIQKYEVYLKTRRVPRTKDLLAGRR